MIQLLKVTALDNQLEDLTDGSCKPVQTGWSRTPGQRNQDIFKAAADGQNLRNTAPHFTDGVSRLAK